MIIIYKNAERLLLKYIADRGPDWVAGQLKNSGEVTISKTFEFETRDLISGPSAPPADGPTTQASEEDDLFSLDMGDEDAEHVFVLAEREGDYYKIPARKLGIQQDVWFSTGIKILPRHFISYPSISIFSKLDRLVSEPIYIGGAHENAIPTEEFERLLKEFPNPTELGHYANSKITKILKDYLQTTTDAERKFDAYLKKRKPAESIRTVDELYAFELQKFQFIREVIAETLAKGDVISETEWQKLMLDFILVIFPKYVAVLEGVIVKDYYSIPGRTKDRILDLALVDASGNIDVVEIKRPFEKSLVSEALYRENHFPRRDLSGTVMQAEKYLFHLNKWGIAGEKAITAQKTSQLPPNLTVKITNPKAIIISGRSNNLTQEQNFDFEIIKRKYANIMDILSYDDLLARLDNIIFKFQGQPPAIASPPAATAGSTTSAAKGGDVAST